LGNTKEVKHEESSNIEASTSSFDVVESDSDSDNELKQLKSMNPKQQLALTIKNWSDLVRHNPADPFLHCPNATWIHSQRTTTTSFMKELFMP
jgi:hypothetical protein